MASAVPGAPHEGPHDPGAYAILQRELDLLVTEGVLSPSVRTDGDVVLWSAMHGMATLLLDGQLDLGPDTDPLATAETVVDTVIQGLVVRSRRARGGRGRTAHETTDDPRRGAGRAGAPSLDEVPADGALES